MVSVEARSASELRKSPGRFDVILFAGIASVSGVLVGLGLWPDSQRAVALAGVMLAAILTAGFESLPTARNRAALPISIAIAFATLLVFGPWPMTLVATAAALTPLLGHPLHGPRTHRGLVRVASAIVATQAAGFAYSMLGGTLGEFADTWQAVPIMAAIGGYFLVQRVSLVFLGRDDDDGRCHSEVLDSLDQGMAVLDNRGLVTHWNEALARIVDCPRERAVGQSLVGAVPVLNQTALPRAIADALKDRRARTLASVELKSVGDGRLLRIKILPSDDGVTVLWHDVGERTRAQQAMRRVEERMALIAEGVNDGLWEWDLKTQELAFSSRFWGMIGLPPSVASRRPADWFDRVHSDDIEPLKQALGEHLSGRTDHVQLEHRVRHEDGTYRGFLCRGVAVRDAQGRATRIAGSMTDTERAIAQDRLRSGFRDPLTGLCNRSVFVERLGQRLQDFKQHRRGRFATLYLDLDRFKLVNDSLGHLVGDDLLIAVSRRLESCLRPGDALARLGGDEFAILLDGLVEPSQANAIAFRIQDTLSAPFAIGGREVFTSASIGIAFCLTDYTNPEEIMRDADTAMYHAKARGKSRHEMFDADMHAQALDRLGLEDDLRHAVKDNDFELHYQPIVTLASGMCVGFEALVRWKRNGQAVSPAQFIPVAEELGLIETLGTWVLQEACHTFAGWQRRFPGQGLECITVNVSTRQLMQQNFRYLVEQAVQKAGLRPRDLRLEITETTVMDSPATVAELLRDLRDFGVKVYLDDFGTGYSSLSHLHKLPVDALKIDSSFVKSLLLDDRPAIVESILALARTLDTSVVAEGVESHVQARELQRLGCRQAQGYFFSPPLPMRAVEELLIAHLPLGRKPVQPVHPLQVAAR